MVPHKSLACIHIAHIRAEQHYANPHHTRMPFGLAGRFLPALPGEYDGFALDLALSLARCCFASWLKMVFLAAADILSQTR